jgi:hypothetical protein
MGRYGRRDKLLKKSSVTFRWNCGNSKRIVTGSSYFDKASSLEE